MEALAHDPVVATAWDLRNVDRGSARFEFQKVQVMLASLQRANAADPRIAELQQYSNRLAIAVESPNILRRATRAILEEANKLPSPIDPDATQIRADVAWAVKSASAKRMPEPPPDFGKMDSNEYRKTVKSLYGYDPGT